MVRLSHFGLVHSICACAALLLNACGFTNVNPRPSDWAPAEEIPAEGACPNISGVYEDSAASCDGSHCHLLNVFLFRTDYPLAERVEITLLSDDTLKIVGGWSGVETEIVLSRSDGDFKCGQEGLTVTSTEDSYFALLSAGYFIEKRTFNRGTDGSLIMRVEHERVGYLGLVPMSVQAVLWARWNAVPPANEPLETGPPEFEY
jgi:hypothetical protein